MSDFTIQGQLVDLHSQQIYPAEVKVKKGRIASVVQVADAPHCFILPGFIDSHVHIESSMLVPTAFARLAVLQGTVATVSDPHEIANVCGAEGVQYMIDNAAQTPFKCCFGAPSCVPATAFETAGSQLDSDAVAGLLQSPDVFYLSEMMNYPGVLRGDSEVMAKIAAAGQHGKPVDGHAPGLTGEAATQYAAAGISTDHECYTLQEAQDKIAAGMKILIREGSAARNFEALHPLLASHPDQVMFCSDDKHPDELVLHHINELVRRSLALGYDLFAVLRAACLNPVVHYSLPVGLLRVDDPADFIVVQDLTSFQIHQTYIDGQLVADGGGCLLPEVVAAPINQFAAMPRQESDFAVPAPDDADSIRVIEALDGQLITRAQWAAPKISGGKIVADVTHDILKIAVINRYEPAALPSVAFIKGFGLQHGALASSVAHDCHNIIAVGTDDASLCAAVNAVIESKGGIAVADGNGTVQCLPLPIAGLMSDGAGQDVAAQYAALDQQAKALGSPLRAPFMTLSFMALLVIPSLKLSDKGLFDGDNFQFVPLCGALVPAGDEVLPA